MHKVGFIIHGTDSHGFRSRGEDIGYTEFMYFPVTGCVPMADLEGDRAGSGRPLGRRTDAVIHGHVIANGKV